ncbi:peroxiredoxin family protein [Alkalicoccus halolimnae]|uniref:Redoxin domain-containing protein n=1 Tax=Alkalicoccus halolimnae TaxID=1667239 RepID=A0A5C7FIJ5_9BACI|nr:redoxin domain-containing protein [Alkalicoccus halolimnae]TXF86114.1 redoxin domain-containing protein [Alkalicoccus halolimnae]
MKKWIFIVIFAGMIGWTFYSTIDWQEGSEEAYSENDSSGNGPPPVPEEEIGLGEEEYAPDFTLETLDGEEVSLSDFRGEKKVMLNFWATWCPPCRAEMPDMQNVYEERDDIEIVAVNLTETEPGTEQVETFREDFGLTFPILLDRDVAVAEQFDIQPVPTSYMIDTNGQIQHIALGPMNEDTMTQIFDDMD